LRLGRRPDVDPPEQVPLDFEDFGLDVTAAGQQVDAA
jgi:hypothetical protein